MSTQAERRLARARAQEKRRTRRREAVYTAEREQRLHGVWLVQLASWSRVILGTRISWGLLQRAMRRVAIYQRIEGGPWYRVSAHLEVQPDGGITIHPTGVGERS